MEIYKKIITLTILITLIACVVGCQTNPSDQPIVGANNTKMVQLLEDQDGEPHDFIKVETPSHVDIAEKKYDNMYLVFDANVNLPFMDAYPITEVKRRVITDDEFLSIIELLSGDNIEMYSDWDLSKQDWLDKQIEYKSKDPEGKLAHDYLDFLQQMFEDAEITVVNPVFDSAALEPELSAYVFVKNSKGRIESYYLPKDRNGFTYFRDMDLTQFPASITKDIYFDKNLDTIEQFNWRKSDNPEITKEDAYEVALSYIDALNIDLRLYSAETCTFLKNVVNKSVGWSFTFTREIANAKARYDLSGFGIDENAMPSYGAPWEIEACTIGIDKDGLCFIEYKGASKISREIQNTVELEKFETIQQRISKQLSYIYGAITRDNGVGLDIVVSQIDLGISMISLKDEAETGIYIPTWYVDYYVKWSDQEDSEKNWDFNTIIFNAVDGSYIEPRVTNEKLMAMMNNN